MSGASRRGRDIRCAVAITAALVALIGCGAPPEEPADQAPPALRATLAIEPPILHIGDVTTVEIVVVTPPEHRVLPYAPPSIPGLWLLEAQPLDPELGAQRWVHRTRLRVRPREVGHQLWPASQVVVETADDRRESLALPERELEVVSVMPDFPERSEPFGLRTPDRATARGGFWLGAGLGALAGMLAMGIALAIRRRTVAGTGALRSEHTEEGDDALWHWAERELQAASEHLPDDPRAAANRAALTLRRYTATRFRVDIESASTEEIAATSPPLRMRSHWPLLVRVLRQLDGERFRPSSTATDRGADASTRRIIEEVRAYVTSTRPRGARR